MSYNKNFNKNNNERVNNVSEKNTTVNDQVSEVNDSPETEVVESDEITEAEADAEEKAISETVGIVIECETLRVRKEPSLDGEILTTIHKGSQVVIDLDKSTNDFYKISYVAGVEGYCMKKFIAVK